MKDVIEQLTSSEGFKVLASIVTGGAFVGWYREHRKGRKDANAFALEFIREQSQRIDKLVQEVAELKAENRSSEKRLFELMRDHENLRDENTQLKVDKTALVGEIERLKTAMQQPHTGGQ